MGRLKTFQGALPPLVAFSNPCLMGRSLFPLPYAVMVRRSHPYLISLVG